MARGQSGSVPQGARLVRADVTPASDRLALEGSAGGYLSDMHIEQIGLIVDDYDEAIKFFVNGLGFDLIEDTPSLTNDGRPKRWVIVRPPGGETALLLAQADGERQKEAIGDQFAGRVGLFLRVDDFDATYTRMRAHDVHFVTAPRHEGYGQVAVFLDLAGNRWDLLGPRPDRPGRATNAPPSTTETVQAMSAQVGDES